jgi:hypothetical protein
MPSKMHVLSIGMYCLVMILMTSCATIPPVNAEILCSSPPLARATSSAASIIRGVEAASGRVFLIVSIISDTFEVGREVVALVEARSQQCSMKKWNVCSGAEHEIVPGQLGHSLTSGIDKLERVTEVWPSRVRGCHFRIPFLFSILVSMGIRKSSDCAIPARTLILAGEASGGSDPRMSLIKAAFLQKLSISAESIFLPIG